MAVSTQWRLQFTIWPFARDQPTDVERLTDDEVSARLQYAGLLAHEADHELRRCDMHVWFPVLERREVTVTPWVIEEETSG